MTARQQKFICFLSNGRRITAVANASQNTPNLLLGQLDTDPGKLGFQELHQFLHWWRALEADLAGQGIRIQLNLGAFGEHRKSIP